MLFSLTVTQLEMEHNRSQQLKYKKTHNNKRIKLQQMHPELPLHDWCLLLHTPTKVLTCFPLTSSSLCCRSKCLTAGKIFKNKLYLKSRVTFSCSDERDASRIKCLTEESRQTQEPRVCTLPLMNQSVRTEGRNKCAQLTGAGADTGLSFSAKFLLEPR